MSVNMTDIYGHPWYWWLAALIVVGALLYFGREIGVAITEKA